MYVRCFYSRIIEAESASLAHLVFFQAELATYLRVVSIDAGPSRSQSWLARDCLMMTMILNQTWPCQIYDCPLQTPTKDQMTPPPYHSNQALHRLQSFLNRTSTKRRRNSATTCQNWEMGRTTIPSRGPRMDMTVCIQCSAARTSLIRLLFMPFHNAQQSSHVAGRQQAVLARGYKNAQTGWQKFYATRRSERCVHHNPLWHVFIDSSASRITTRKTC